MAFKVGVWAIEGDEGTGEEFEGNCLDPSDVASFRFPVAGECAEVWWSVLARIR
jgi:hypothetical protein